MFLWSWNILVQRPKKLTAVVIPTSKQTQKISFSKFFLKEISRQITASNFILEENYSRRKISSNHCVEFYAWRKLFVIENLFKSKRRILHLKKINIETGFKMLKKVLRRNEGGQNPEKDYFTMEKLVSNPGLSHIAVLIFSLLRFDFPYPDDLNTCRLVCKSWRGVIDTSLFYWRKRLAFPTRNKWLTTEYWKKFDLAYSSVLNHKVWTEVTV